MTAPTLPANRGRWRLTLHTRAYSFGAMPGTTGVGELVGARSRRLEQTLNAPAKLTFTINGADQAAALIQELATDVVAYRWDEYRAKDQMMFRGVITRTEDQLTEQSHTVNVEAVDYLGVLSRRYLTGRSPLVFTATDQDDIVATLLARVTALAATASGQSLAPGSFLPLTVRRLNPDGTTRPNSGQIRDRTYVGGSEVLQQITELSAVIGGFDFDAWATSDGNTPGYGSGTDTLRVFYPAQGVTRTDVAFVYGGTVSGLTRTVTSSAPYANYARVLGSNADADPTAPQLVGESWNPDANNVSVAAQGLWMTTDDQSDVSQQATLDQKAQGMVGVPDGSSRGDYGLMVPSYSLTMRPGAYRWGSPNMGDTVPLVVDSGRLHVDTTVRVLGINYGISDDTETEDVEVVVGRPAITLAGLLTGPALARR